MLKYIKKYWWAAILAPLFMLGEVFMDLMQPRMMSIIVDDGVLGLNNNGVGNLNLVIHTGLMMIAFVAIGGVCGILSGVFANIAGQNFGNDLRKDMFNRIMSFSFSQTDKFQTGSLITRVTNDVTQVQTFVQMAIRGFVRTFMLFIGGLICMLSLNLSFGVVIVISLPLIILCVIYFISKANPKFSILQKKLDNLNNVMQENVSGSRVVKAYVREDYEINRFEKTNKELVDTQLDVLLLLSFMTPIMNIILNYSVVAIIKVGQINVYRGVVTPGEVMAAITYVSQVLNAIMRMNMIFQTASRGVASWRRIKEVLDCVPVIRDGNFNGKKEARGKIEFDHVSFAYPTQEETMIIKDFSLVINPGETIGILGETGCGKSSLVNLIPRFYDVTAGRILIDDVDVRDYKLKDLRDLVSIALQKSEIFNQTIGENISWGNKKASYDEIMHAANISMASEFIDSKPEGIGTMVSQGGTSLSGGQKQRVAIARAVLKKASILIFDDATSALDLKTEANLYKNLNSEYPNMTKIIVAQRIASVKDADRIVIIEDGRLSAVGSHSELLETSGVYRDIYNSQLGGSKDA
ncbi:ABC transporter ATP-binding protein [Lachnospira multipara]|uniref:ABC transporter ATP-binding protein n=1 Tax=Lachnospira multipara TaxID=28051 RepID=UPI0004E1DD35|nr:ABC transporter ATP-binding protein [Lachnospira multipara]